MHELLGVGVSARGRGLASLLTIGLLEQDPRAHPRVEGLGCRVYA